MSTVLLLCISLAVPAGDPDDLSWSLPFLHTIQGWTRQPSWQGNPSPTASITTDGNVACFAVDEPGLGMKWSLETPAVPIDEATHLVIRYRAECLDTSRTDYLVYLDDRVPGRDLCAIRLNQTKADGAWHVAAADLSEMTRAKTFHRIAVQVPAGPRGKARLWIDWIALMESPPSGAEVLARGAVAKRPDVVVPLAQMKWESQPSWLGNPAPPGEHQVERTPDTTIFHVRRGGCGMKWSSPLSQAVPLEDFRYVSIRYRATPGRARGDYTMAVLGKRRGKGMDYETAIPVSELACDGRWHVLSVDLPRTASVVPVATGLAVQFQALAPDARLEVTDLRFTQVRRSSMLADPLDWRPADKFPEGFQTIPLGPLANARSESWLRRLRIADWFLQPLVTIGGIPFSLAAKGPDLAATTIARKSELRVPCDVPAVEVYLLLMAAMSGEEEPAYGGGKFKAIRDVDRFRLQLEYADGPADECLPLNVTAGQFGIVAGPQLVVAAADPSKRLAGIVLCDRSKQAAFAIVAITVRTGKTRLFPAVLEETPPLRVRDSRPSGNRPERKGGFSMSRHGPPSLEQVDHVPSGFNLLAAPSPLVGLRVDGKPIPPDALERLPPDNRPPGATRLLPGDANWCRVRGTEGLFLGISAVPEGEDGLRIAVRVHNAGPKERLVGIVAPRIGPYRLTDKPDDAWYLFPKRGAAVDNRPCAYRERYCGLFPVQFLDTLSPADSRGLVLRTTDTACLPKHYLLEKKNGQFTLGVEYPERTLRPGETLATADAVIALTDGDPYRGLEAYRKWLAGWHRPISPRRPWFREVFNFRQRFLWWLDPLYDSKAGKIDLAKAVEEARREFGGIDYLHLFDWGNCGPYGRIYGRTGDYSPYDYLQGSRDALRQAIAGVQAQGVPVGLYIEAYLLDERGKLGQAHGKAWQLVRQDGSRAYWPESSEMYVCPFVPAWREVQASTYATKVRELGADGMYLDEYGFAAWVDCWSKDHGHGVPAYAVEGERDCTRMVRERIESVKRGVALYSEETPVDVTTQYQDGSFTYAMSSAATTETRVPLNLTRFAIPDFKTIEILYCDKPTGSWATGVKWVFFNGEAIWLEGPAAEWFEPETRETIRRCHAILRKHRDAFTTLDPVPLVPTQTGGVWANAFPTANKTVYTLYNARHRTVRGEMLHVPASPGARFLDEWNTRPAMVRREGGDAIVSLEIGPNDVGCVVMER